MSHRKLKSLTAEGLVVTRNRLRSGKHEYRETMSTSDIDEVTHNANASGAAAIQELQQKLAMAAEEVKTVKADLTSQLQQAMEVAEYAKEQCDEEKTSAGHGE